MTVDLPIPSAVSPLAETPAASCGSCTLHNAANLKRLGLHVDGCDAVVALAGNPNTGKSTVFNALTGLRQHVGNWPGTTVSRAEGGFSLGGSAYKVVDLPGTYSLLSNSRDEDVARDFLLFGDPDVTVVVVDATRLERNLNLVLQVLQVTGRVVVALNLMDEARRHGIEVDVRHLSRELGVPVVPMAARRGEGVPELLGRIADMTSGETRVRPRRQQALAPVVARAVDELAGQLSAEFPGLANARWVALRLLEGDAGTERAVRDGSLGDLARQQTARIAS
ncbi:MULTISPECIES: FeoB small GTPase domain-containing protein [unclassified Nocardioides]|uniref:FeoB small GTPase domain-containing protein n=1 Tax=unclassified Nocardioides TaxID=2615069 RepID=UPI0006F2C40C|nr:MULTISPECIES: FeoB small GTPase domain-containing protein [unclassified Nocardioides]KRA38945.1 iron transporter FeoB [Nocardioides sp. Root614]KRA92904.1 iron transporter FeoB [Nocardioides sp. Root682]